MIQNYFYNVKGFLGSFILNARVGSGETRAFTLIAAARPRSGQKRAGKKERGLGEGIFARPAEIFG